MSNYFNDKIKKIKNVKDSHLSKNIFRIINGFSIGEELAWENIIDNTKGNNKK